MTTSARGVNDQLARILDEVGPLQPIDVTLTEAFDCVLAENVHTPWPLPPFDTADVDGFAIAAADSALARSGGTARFQVIDEVFGGRMSSQRVTPGRAIRVTRGSPVPAGADAVAPLAATRGTLPNVTLAVAVARGENIRPVGSHAAAGAIVLPSGTRLDPYSTGVAASAGRGRLVVHPTPRVAVVVCGTELVNPGSTPSFGTVTDQTGPVLSTAIAQIGGKASRIGPLPDDPRVIADAISDQLTRADLIVTSGGIGTGPYDAVGPLMRQATGREISTVAMSPGGRIGFGWLAGTPVLNLPGHPVDAAVMFEVFAAPVLRRMMGHRQLQRPMLHLSTTVAIPTFGDVQRFVAGRIRSGDGGHVFEPSQSDPQMSLMELAKANGLAVLPPGIGTVAPGSLLQVLPLTPIAP